MFELLKQTIRPEFLNRIDELVMFAPLNLSQIEEIVRLQISLLKRTLEQNGIRLEITEKAIHLIADLGFDPQFGARPVKRAIQKYGIKNFKREIISVAYNSEDLNRLEIYYINLHDAINSNNYYNIASGGKEDIR